MKSHIYLADSVKCICLVLHLGVRCFRLSCHCCQYFSCRTLCLSVVVVIFYYCRANGFLFLSGLFLNVHYDISISLFSIYAELFSLKKRR